MDMDTPEPITPAAPSRADTPSRPAVPVSRSALSGVALVAALMAAVVAAAAWWRAGSPDQATASTATELALARTDIDGLRRAIDLDRRERELLRQRLGDLENVNKTLREEVLGVTERARVLEDAIANLAHTRLSGHDAVLLDEAESVLLLAKQRFELFHDAASAQQAYRIADSALSALQDPAFATVRETVAVELRSLAALGQNGAGATLAELAELRQLIATLPLSHSTEPTGAAGNSRMWRVLGQFVRITRAGPGGAPVRDPALLRNFIVLDLRAAELAVLERNDAAVQAALSRVRAQLDAGFVGDDATVKRVVAALTRLGAQAPAAPLPELGAALKELRNLRATQRVPAAGADGTAP